MPEEHNHSQPPDMVAAAPPPRRMEVYGVTAFAIENMNRARPWMKFIAISGFVFAAISAIFGVVVLVSSRTAGLLLGGVSEAGISIGFSLLYFFAAVVQGYGSYLLLKLAHSTKGLEAHNAHDNLENYAIGQHGFWRFVGLMTAIYLTLVPVLFIAAVAVAAASGGFNG